MRETKPEVYLIARPVVDLEEMERYLKAVGGEDWLVLRTPKFPKQHNFAQLLCEFAGRLCYRSWKPGLNANVTKTRDLEYDYFDNLIKSQHGSVLEHANFTFVFHNVSRVFTHELVRHRAGSAFSQESLRYVRLTDIGFRVPPALEKARDKILSIVETLEEAQRDFAEELSIDEDGLPFHVKKEMTSAMRRLAPLGLSTDIVWTANVRTLRHVIRMRTADGAEEELKLVFRIVHDIMKKEAPLLFRHPEVRV